MLKFKKTGGQGTPTSSPLTSPSSLRRPKLVTRIDSIGGPSERERISLFENEPSEDVSSGDSSVSEFGTPEVKLRDVTKNKLNRLKKKQQKESLRKELNILCTKDFSCRQHELKIWINETTGKDVSTMSEKKLMEYFKKFVKKWNAKKLSQKYYRGVDLHSSPLPASRTSQLDVPGGDGNGLWIAPPIPMISSLSTVDVNEQTSTPTAVTGSSFGRSFINLGHASSTHTKLCLEEVECRPRTTPKPPERQRIATVVPSRGSRSEANAATPASVRVPQPRMGSLVSSMRRSIAPSTPAVGTCVEQKLKEGGENHGSAEIEKTTPVCENTSDTQTCDGVGPVNPVAEKTAPAQEQGISTEEHMKSTEEQVESTGEQVEATEKQVESTEEQMKSAEEQVESTKEESVEEQMESTEKQMESTEEQVEFTEEKVESAEEQMKSTEKQMGSTDEPVRFSEPAISARITDSSKKKVTATEDQVISAEKLARETTSIGVTSVSGVMSPKEGTTLPTRVSPGKRRSERINGLPAVESDQPSAAKKTKWVAEVEQSKETFV